MVSGSLFLGDLSTKILVFGANLEFLGEKSTISVPGSLPGAGTGRVHPFPGLGDPCLMPVGSVLYEKSYKKGRCMR